jgi:hypothetical protein
VVGYFFGNERNLPLNRWIAYIGGATGALFVAFSETNWANSVESEVYGPSLAIMTLMLWLTLRYFEERGTPKANKTLVLVYYIAIASIAIHLTPYLIVPVLSIFFILKQEATPRDWAWVCGFVLAELLLILAFAQYVNAGLVNTDFLSGMDARRGVLANEALTQQGEMLFYIVTAILGLVLLWRLYKKINWALALAIVCLSSIMIDLSLFIEVAPVGLVVLAILAGVAKSRGWDFKWKVAMAILVVGIIGFSSHLYIPIRSAHNPRIDENNPDRDFTTFVNYLDRKQYGQRSMIERMFQRRGSWSNQFGRHPNMGYWSYFESQYSPAGWAFLPFLALGFLGMFVAIRKRLEIGLPYLTLFLVCSVGLVLYMNFADGTRYNFQTGDAYLEVRNRDYFFTPAFVFFGIAMGMGISGIIQYVRDRLTSPDSSLFKTVTYASTVLVFLPVVSLTSNYHPNDRSNNYLPYNYAANLLDSCDENAILFTSGDNDTFPVWCLQEVYNYRKDVRVVNLSLLNTDWYVWQMKSQYDVPISLSKEQIWWYPTEDGGSAPRKPFRDKPRGRTTLLQPSAYEGQLVKVQDMMVDEIVLENRWKDPIYFSSQPYAESPLKLRDRATTVGVVYRLDREPPSDLMDLDKGLYLFRDVYRFGGYESSEVYRDENATGVFLSVGMNAVRVFDALRRDGRAEESMEFISNIIDKYPEYWQATYVYSEALENAGDTTAALDAMWKLHDTLTAFLASNHENLFYMQDLGMVKVDLGRKTNDSTLIDNGLDLMWQAFDANSNSSYAFQKLVTVLVQLQRVSELQRAVSQFEEYKINLTNPTLQRVKQAIGMGTPRAPTGQNFNSPEF